MKSVASLFGSSILLHPLWPRASTAWRASSEVSVTVRTSCVTGTTIVSITSVPAVIPRISHLLARFNNNPSTTKLFVVSLINSIFSVASVLKVLKQSNYSSNYLNPSKNPRKTINLPRIRILSSK